MKGKLYWWIGSVTMCQMLSLGRSFIFPLSSLDANEQVYVTWVSSQLFSLPFAGIPVPPAHSWFSLYTLEAHLPHLFCTDNVLLGFNLLSHMSKFHLWWRCKMDRLTKLNHFNITKNEWFGTHLWGKADGVEDGGAIGESCFPRCKNDVEFLYLADIYVSWNNLSCQLCLQVMACKFGTLVSLFLSNVFLFLPWTWTVLLEENLTF